MNDFFDVCCPSKSRATVIGDEAKVEIEPDYSSPTAAPYIMIPDNDATTHQRAPKVPKGQPNMSKKKEKEVNNLINDIDKIVDGIKDRNSFSSKEEADLEKTLSVLRNQLNPKRRAKKEAFKRFQFSIFKNQPSKDGDRTIVDSNVV